MSLSLEFGESIFGKFVGCGCACQGALMQIISRVFGGHCTRYFVNIVYAHRISHWVLGKSQKTSHGILEKFRYIAHRTSHSLIVLRENIEDHWSEAWYPSISRL